MYFIILIVIIYLLYGSDNWLALLIKNYWWQSWLIFSIAYFALMRKIDRDLEIMEQEKYEAKLQQRFNYLIDKYSDAQIAQMIMDRTFWVGATEEQLLDAIGRPEKIDDKVLKSKRIQIWRYNQISKRSFGLSITLENGVVVGWDKK